MSKNVYCDVRNHPNVIALQIFKNAKTYTVVLDKQDKSKVDKYTWYIKEGKNGIIIRSKLDTMQFLISGVSGKDTLIFFNNSNKLDMRRKNLLIVKKNTYILGEIESILEIRTNLKMNNSPAIVKFSTSDYNKIKDISWCISTEGYCIATASKYDICPTTIRMHRLLLCGHIPNTGDVVDHINRDRLDNRHTNLRLVDISTNILNSPTKNSFGKTGVYENRNRIYAAWPTIFKNGKKHTVSFSITKHGREEAIKLAIAARRQWEIDNNIICD